MYDDLVKKLNATDIGQLFKVKDYHNKIGVTEAKIPSITGLATTADLTAVENNLPKDKGLVKKKILKQKYQILRENILLLLIIIIYYA